MKYTWLIVLILLGIISLSAIPAGAVTAAATHFVPPSWAQTIPPNTRFVVLSNMNNEAVLDKETGLVWAKTTAPGVNMYTWQAAMDYCTTLVLGGRSGWRLPTVEEQASIAYMIPAIGLSISPAAPFILNDNEFWTATTDENNQSYAWVVFNIGYTMQQFNGYYIKTGGCGVWCVRGPK